MKLIGKVENNWHDYINHGAFKLTNLKIQNKRIDVAHLSIIKSQITPREIKSG